MVATPTPTAPSSRLVSLDAARGFDMFWIPGADALVLALGELSASPACGSGEPIATFAASSVCCNIHDNKGLRKSGRPDSGFLLLALKRRP